MLTQAERTARFRALHRRDHAFIIPNPWDAGSAQMLARLGFEALATTSAGFALSAGKSDNAATREEALAHCRLMVESSSLPVSADLGPGFGDQPEAVAETIRLAAATGLAGASIEDGTGRAADPLYDLELAAARIRAAADAARATGFEFMLTARAENFIVGRPDLRDTVRRLQAYQEAGADVLFAPGIKTKAEIAAVVSSVDRPVNVLAGMPGFPLELSALSALGVKRVSVGSALARAAYGAMLRGALELQRDGTFRFADDGPPTAELNG